jgi:outer membrane lipopolysaccharide assembly protein LptE/RlpB
LQGVDQIKADFMKELADARTAESNVSAMLREQLETRTGELHEARDRIRELELAALTPARETTSAINALRRSSLLSALR